MLPTKRLEWAMKEVENPLESELSEREAGSLESVHEVDTQLTYTR